MKYQEGGLVKWQKTVAANTDGYGSGVILYAQRWAELMEEKIDAGLKVADVADGCSEKANEGMGITGFMYGCAVGILAFSWLYGEDLRRWHNLTTQRRDEGERANESGGVLNPALLSIG